MGYELIGTPKVERVTRDLATRFRDMLPVPHDRALKPLRLEAYKKMIAAGLFRPVHWAVAVCLETRETYRANGKHTSTVLACDDVEIPDSLVAIQETYQCDTLEDVAKLYATFDSRYQVRTTNDINRAFAAIDPDLCEISQKIVSLCVTAVWYSRMQSAMHSLSAQDRAEALLEKDVKAFVGFVSDLLSETSTRQTQHMRRGAVVAAMFLTWSRSRRAACEFWQAVRDESGAHQKMPDRVLARYLLTKTVKNGSTNSRVTSGVAVPREMFVKCIHAWNAWRKDTTTDLKYHAQAKIPAAV